MSARKRNKPRPTKASANQPPALETLATGCVTFAFDTSFEMYMSRAARRSPNATLGDALSAFNAAWLFAARRRGLDPSDRQERSEP